MRYLLTGGGTGGHIYPALTIADELKLQDPKAELLYVGTTTGREAGVVPRHGIPFATISSGGLVNLSLVQKVKGGFKALKGVLEAVGHIRRFKPDVVIGTGGFVCGPVLLAARLSGTTVVIQEQNAFPGVTNRVAARWAHTVFVPYKEARPYFPEKARLEIMGNPIRSDVMAATREGGRRAFGFAESDRVLVVMGGSGGGRDFNRFVADAVKALADIPSFKVLHITGERYYDAVKEQYGGDYSFVTVAPYLHNMPDAYAAADAGVFRAGAITLAEIQARRLPSVLIPSPNVTHNHQDWNARTLESRGAALVVRESEMSTEKLASALRSVLTEDELRAGMQGALREVAQPEAARELAQAIMRIASQKH